MAIQIRITHNINSVTEFLDDLKTKALVNAARMSMNRTVSAMRTQANRMAREVRKIKAGELNRDFFRVEKAKGNSLGRLEAKLQISGRSMSLIRFVVGDKTPASQKGIPVQARKRLRVEVYPGRKVTLKGAFIAQGRGNNMQVFRRKGKDRTPIVKQATSALSTLFEKEPFRTTLEKFGSQRLGIEFGAAFKYELEKIQLKKF